MNASQTDPLTYLDEVDARHESAFRGPFGEQGALSHARQDIPALSKALRAVLGMHQEGRKSAFDPVGMWVGSVCRHCRKEWPCPTVRAIQAALAVNNEGGTK